MSGLLVVDPPQERYPGVGHSPTQTQRSVVKRSVHPSLHFLLITDSLPASFLTHVLPKTTGLVLSICLASLKSPVSFSGNSRIIPVSHRLGLPDHALCQTFSLLVDSILPVCKAQTIGLILQRLINRSFK